MTPITISYVIVRMMKKRKTLYSCILFYFIFLIICCEITPEITVEKYTKANSRNIESTKEKEIEFTLSIYTNNKDSWTLLRLDRLTTLPNLFSPLKFKNSKTKLFETQLWNVPSLIQDFLLIELYPKPVKEIVEKPIENYFIEPNINTNSNTIDCVITLSSDSNSTIYYSQYSNNFYPYTNSIKDTLPTAITVKTVKDDDNLYSSSSISFSVSH